MLYYEFIPQFLESISLFEHFERKDDPRSLCISGSTDWEVQTRICINKYKKSPVSQHLRQSKC